MSILADSLSAILFIVSDIEAVTASSF